MTDWNPPNWPLIHVRDDAKEPVASRGYPGELEDTALCGSSYPRSFKAFVDTAPMGGQVCAICQHRAEARIAENQAADDRFNAQAEGAGFHYQPETDYRMASDLDVI